MRNLLKTLAITAIIATQLAAQTSVWDGTYDTTWYRSSQRSFTITTAAQLAGLARLVNNGIAANSSGAVFCENSFREKTIILANDIDLDGRDWTPIGNWHGICGQFGGIFDGNGHSISNLLVRASGYGGLFGDVAGGQIKNLVVNVLRITTPTHYNTAFAGGLAGQASGTIENCGVNIRDNINGLSAGGLVGRGYALTIKNSYSSGNVFASSLSGVPHAGGLIGYGEQTITIINSYSTSNVSASVSNRSSYSGGLVGYAINRVDITNSYSSGIITAIGEGGTKNIGGIFGDYLLGTYNSVYYNSEGASSAAGGVSSISGILAKTPDELRQTATFVGWDLENTWNINSTINNGFPYLRYFADSDNTSIGNPRKTNNRHGIRFAENPVSEQAEISVVLPDASTGSATETRITIYDMTGNVVFECKGTACLARSSSADKASRVLTWNLRNTAGRFVANGTYLVIAEVKDLNGNLYRYSARLGVKR